jgi:predicted nucleotidyltransferase
MYTNDDIHKITNMILSECPETSAIYLFGSYAKGISREDSDIDIAILFPHNLHWKDRKDKLNRLYKAAGAYGYPIDFLLKTENSFEDLKKLPTLSRTIEREGKILWKR